MFTFVLLASSFLIMDVSAKEHPLSKDELDILWLDEEYGQETPSDSSNYYFSEGLFGIDKAEKDENGDLINVRWGFINKDGEEVIPFDYEEVKPFSEGLAVVKKNGKYGCINKENQVVIPFEYKNLGSFSEGLAIARKDKNFGFIDKNGEVRIDFKYFEVYPFSDGLAVAVFRHERGGFLRYYVDKSGNEMSCNYRLGSFKDGRAIVSNDNIVGYNYGIIDKNLNAIGDFKYSGNSIGEFAEGFCSFELYEDGQSKMGFLNINGEQEILLPENYVFEGSTAGNPNYKKIKFKEGLVPIRDFENDILAYMDTNGEIVIKLETSPEYRTIVHGFSDGLSIIKETIGYVAITGTSKVIDKSGKTLASIESVYCVSDFKEGYSIVIEKSFYGELKVGILKKSSLENSGDTTTDTPTDTSTTSPSGTEVDTAGSGDKPNAGGNSEVSNGGNSGGYTGGGDISTTNTTANTSKKEEKKEDKEADKEKEELPLKAFSDVNANDWFYGAVEFMNEKGFMNGVDNENFAPELNSTRAMMWQIFYNLKGRPEVDQGGLSSDEWFAEARAWALLNALSDGTMPNENVTREQVVVMLYRLEGSPKIEDTDLATNFDDASDISEWAMDAMKWALANNIINGKGNRVLDPSGNATRAEIATLFMNYLK